MSIVDSWYMNRTRRRLKSLQKQIKSKRKERVTSKERGEIVKMRRSLEKDFDTYKRGKENENRLLYIVRKRHIEWPTWFLRVDEASRSLDEEHGIDVLATTSKGKVPLQVKSSENFLNRHYRKHPNISAIVVNSDLSDDDIYRKFMSVVSFEMAHNRFHSATN